MIKLLNTDGNMAVQAKEAEQFKRQIPELQWEHNGGGGGVTSGGHQLAGRTMTGTRRASQGATSRNDLQRIPAIKVTPAQTKR